MKFLHSLFVLFCLVVAFQCTTTAPKQPEPATETPVEEKPAAVVTRSLLPTSGCCELHQEFMNVVVLDQVCITEKDTKLRLYTKESKKVCVLKEGMLFQDDLGTSFSFLKSEGVGLCPKRTQMKQKPFFLYFDRISNEATTFDLVEDKNAKHAHIPWSFYKVDLTSCQWK